MNGGIVIPNEDIVLMAEKEEPRFLNILLKNRDCLQDALSYGIIPSENNQVGHFLGEKNNLLYAIMRNHFLEHGVLLTRSAIDSRVDRMTIGTEEERSSVKSYWDKIWNRHDGAVEDYGMLRESLNDRYLLMQFYKQWKNGDQIIKSISGHSKLVKNYLNDLNAIKNLDPDSYSVTMGLDEGVDEAMKYIDNKRINPHDENSIRCGIDAIDKRFNGFSKPSYTVISGIVNGGKTTFMMNIGFNMAKLYQKNVAYVSLEKDAKLFFRRTLACHALTDYNRIKKGGNDQWGLSDYWYGKLQDAAKDLKSIKANYHCLQFIQDTKLTKILAEVDKLHARKKLDVLIVDYLQVIGLETNTVGRHDVDLANVHKRLMAYGRKHNLVIFTALQLKNSSSKDIRKKAEKVTNESQMSSVSVNTEDYAGSQMIIADADNALGVVLNGDKPATKMFVSFSKARDDASRDTICLDVDLKVGRVCDPEYGAGNVRAIDVDKELFEKNSTEEELESDDNLFKEAEEIEKITSSPQEQPKSATPKADPVSDIISDQSFSGEDAFAPEKKEEKPSEDIVKDPPRKRGQSPSVKLVTDSDPNDIFAI
jgi:replicative DNA helicase